MKNIFNFKKNINRYNKAGFSLVEVLVACMIITTTTLALMSSTSKGIELSNKALRQVQASMLIEEGIESVKSIRDTNWTTISNLTPDINYYLSFNSNIWVLDTIPVSPIDEIFTRTVVFSQVYRDNNDDISSAGEIDLGIKKVNITVTWLTPGGINSKNIIFYLANIFN